MVTESNKYTLEEIKKAFWATFHERGELFFPYAHLGDEKEKDEAVQLYWEDFIKHLEE